MRKAFVSVLGLAIVAGAVLASVASAANEQLKLREVYPDNGGTGSYIVLQAYAPNQNHLAGKTISWIANPPTGGSFPGSYTIPSDVGNSASQMTVLLAAPGFTGPPAADFTVPGLQLWDSYGEVCLNGINCVIWGGGGGFVPTEGIGFRAFEERGIPAGKAMIRSIGRGCSTLLERLDDTEQATSDWFQTPAANPRNNASPITERPCDPPNSGINSSTVSDGETTSSTSARIAFAASPFLETTYECKLDSGAFAPCVSPVEYTALDGSGANGTPHKFEVRATDASGVEQTPATLNWVVNTSLAPDSNQSGDPAGPAPSAAAATAVVAGTSASSAAPVRAAAADASAPATAKPKKHRLAKHRHARHARR